MRMSIRTDYALRTLMSLATSETHQSIAEIARQYDISRNHLMKVAQDLVSNGYAESVLGRSGGLKLARPAEELNVGDIVRTLEDTGNFVECFNPSTNECVVTPVCGLRHVLAGGVEKFLLHLDQFTIADLVGDRDTFRQSLIKGADRHGG
jgi:Rrf2 family transcriptional regulator, nitric oxide-sensitive transcriptional repressor